MTQFEQEIIDIEIKLRSINAVEEAMAKIPEKWDKPEIDIPVLIPIKNDTDSICVKIRFIKNGSFWDYKHAELL